ncbi:MAG: phosphotransferase [Balneolaceae bacterium]|nr:phosphotransferase [Balneolaceae bacterium]
MNLATKFRNTHPHAFFLDPEKPNALKDYLSYQEWIDSETDITSIENAGEDTMNKVVRVHLTNGKSYIIKQSRPWVEKYPDIPAPAERGNIEGAYFQEAGANDTIASFSPELLNADPDAHILMLEDLGEGTDLTYLYKKENSMDENVLAALMDYLSALHQNFTQATCDFYIENRGMRKLNAEHIFRFPFVDDNGLNLDDITPGLADLRDKYRTDKELMEQVAFLQYRYLQNGETLLQGDYYPGSFIHTADGIKVIDPEFCFFGDAEFDLGVFYAHLLMAQQPKEIIDSISDHYKKPPTFSDMLYQQYAGIEIMRRILGLAQLPLPLHLDEKEALLEQAYAMLLEE